MGKKITYIKLAKYNSALALDERKNLAEVANFWQVFLFLLTLSHSSFYIKASAGRACWFFRVFLCMLFCRFPAAVV